MVHARRSRRAVARSVREGGTGLLSRWAACRERIRTLRRRHRPAHAPCRVGDPARADLRGTRHQARLQRRHRLHTGWQPHHRAGLESAELLAQRRPQLRRDCRGRRGLATRRMDRRRRTHHRHARGRPAPVRRLCHRCLSEGEERGSLRQRLHGALPRRGTPRRSPSTHRALPREDAGSRGGIRAEVRLGAPQLVRARGPRPGGPLVVPPVAVVRARRRRVPQRAGQRRRAGHDSLRQGARQRPGRSRIPGSPGGQPLAPNGTHRTLPCAQHLRRSSFRIHDSPGGGGSLLPRLGGRISAPGPRLAPSPDARRRLGSLREPDGGHGRPGRGGTEVPGSAVPRLRRRLGQQRLPLADREGCDHRYCAGEAHASQLRRRTRLGDSPRHRIPEHDL